MAAVTVNDILNWLDGWAPFSSAEQWDNVGLQTGCRDTPVTKVLTALDVTPSVINQAAAMGAELIVSHHPVIFHPLHSLDSDQPPYMLARHGLSAIAAHTNLDKASGGVNDILADLLGLRDVNVAGDGICRVGRLDLELQPAEFAVFAGKRLGVPQGGIQWTDGRHPVRTVAVCSGAGGDYLSEQQADAFVTGELHYHEWPVRAPDMTIVAAGHYYTEIPVAQALAERITRAFPFLTAAAAKTCCPFTFL